jgi:hypothetical protein
MSDDGMKPGTPQLKSGGPIAFGPDDVLFVADNRSATVYAIDVADDGEAGPADTFDLDDLDSKLCGFLGCSLEDLVLRDMAVHPRTHNIYFSIMRGRGSAGVPLILKLDHRDATLSEVSLENVRFSQVSIENAPAEDDQRTDFSLVEPDGNEVAVNEIELPDRTLKIAMMPARMATITDLAYADGVLLVAGMSNEEFASNLRRIPFPFNGEAIDNSTEIFHVSHGMWETAAPIRTFVPYEGGKSILASYTCTPLVHFSLGALKGGDQVKGRTVAELGHGNQPLDMVSYSQGSDEYVLVANSSYPLMKFASNDIDAQAGLTEPQEPRGVSRVEVDVPGVIRMDNFNGDYVLVLQQDDSGSRHLRSLKTASL